MEQDFYKILGVSPDAQDRDVKRAYYALASKLHPDKAKDSSTRKQNEEELARISAAYNTLKDAAKRKEYDVRRRGEVPAGNGSSASGGNTPSPTASSTTTPTQSRATPSPPASSQQGRGSGSAPGNKVKGTELVGQRTNIAERAFVKGMQLFNTQNFAESVPFLEAAVQNDDSKAAYQMKLAIALIRSRGSYNRAVEYAQRAVEIDPYNLDYKLSFADIHETAGAVTAARKMYEDVLRWDPNNASAKMRLDMMKGGRSGTGGGFLANLIKKLTQK